MRTINADQLDQMISSGEKFLLLNVLDEEQFRQHHVPSSRNVPVNREDFVEMVESMAGDKDRTVVVYCANPACTASPTAARKLEEAGFTDVVDFEGGMEEWEKAQRPVEKGAAA